MSLYYGVAENYLPFYCYHDKNSDEMPDKNKQPEAKEKLCTLVL